MNRLQATDDGARNLINELQNQIAALAHEVKRISVTQGLDGEALDRIIQNLPPLNQPAIDLGMETAHWPTPDPLPAQRGELDAAFEALREITGIPDIGPASWRCDCGHTNVTRTCINCGMKPPPYDAALYATPDPLPAQTEPGERCIAESGPNCSSCVCRFLAGHDGLHENYHGTKFGSGESTTPPSPAPECAHD